MSRLTGTPVRVAREYELEFLDRMPEEAVKKIEDIFADSQNRFKVMNARTAQINDLNQKILQERAIVAELRDEARRKRHEKAIVNLQAQIARLNSSVPIPYPNEDEMNDWIGRNFRNNFELYIPDVKEPANPVAALKQIRDKIDKLEKLRLRAENAPLPSGMAEQQIISEISNLAASGAPDFTGPFRYDFISAISEARSQGRVRWPETYITPQVIEVDGRSHTGQAHFIPNGFAFTAWLFKDQLIARAKEEVAKLARDDEALSLEERKATVRKLDAEILELEREEEVIREWADVPRRAQNALTERAPSMLAILGIRPV